MKQYKYMVTLIAFIILTKTNSSKKYTKYSHVAMDLNIIHNISIANIL